MSADLLRRAATLMHKEAREPHMITVLKRRTVCGARVHHGPDGPHHRDPDHPKWCNAAPAGATQPAPSDYERAKAVALAVAQLLNDAAVDWEDYAADGNTIVQTERYFAQELSVARAYLGEPS